MYEQYRYQPLPPISENEKTPTFSRLLRLLAAAFNSPLACSLITVDVERCPQYEALSYTWGTAEPTALINVDGRFLSIKPNLDGALRHLRLTNQDRYLWIDAICINQQDVSEKTRQVQYMREIYKNAARAIVWLGMKTRGVDLAFRLAQRLAELETMLLADVSAQQGIDLVVRAEMISDVIRDSPEGSLECLNELLQREYFDRVWCIQEIVACAWPIARCEELEMPFFDILSTARFMYHVQGRLVNGQSLQFWYALHKECLEWRKNDNREDRSKGSDRSLGPLLHLLGNSRDFKATDPRDKLFAMFGISNEGLDPILARTEIMTSSGEPSTAQVVFRQVLGGIRDLVNEQAPNADFLRPKMLKPDYSKSCVEVYRDFARYEMRRSPRYLNVLHHVHHNEPSVDGSFPSWVPKWHEPRTSQYAPTGLYLAGLCDGHFRHFAVVHDNPLNGDAIHPNILSVDGFHVDDVVSVSDILNFETMHSDIPLEKTWQSLFGFPLFPRYEQTYRNGEPLDIAFCLALGMGAIGTACIVIGDEWDQTGKLPGHGPGKMDATVLQDVMHADVARYIADYFTAQGFFEQRPVLAAGKTPPGMDGSGERYANGARALGKNRRLFVTRNGYLGLGPKVMCPGDQVCVLYGGRLPFVIRPLHNSQYHLFLGVSYIHDYHIMWGKACEAVRFNHQGCTFKQQTFHFQ